MEAVTWGFIGTVIGAIASIATTAITNWSSHYLAQISKMHEREELARCFQRETLLELQSELLEYMRTCSQVYLHDRKIFKEKGIWGGFIAEDINIKNREHSAKTSILIQRIADDDLREQLQTLKDIAYKCLLADNERDASTYYSVLSDTYEAINDNLGLVLRATYQASNA